MFPLESRHSASSRLNCWYLCEEWMTEINWPTYCLQHMTLTMVSAYVESVSDLCSSICAHGGVD